MNILLLSAYDAASHRYWREQLVAGLPQHRWTVLALPARHFNWRVRGNSLSWALNQRRVLEQPYDVIVATSMVDVAGLRALVPALARIPTLVYWHENQFAYPLQPGSTAWLEPRLANLFTALAADRLVFNSAWNRDSFIRGVDAFLRQMPDERPQGAVEAIAAKASVLPVALEAALAGQPARTPQGCHAPLRLLWNHRWEYDKGPDRLLVAVEYWLAQGFAFRLDILGQAFRSAPPSLQALLQRLQAQAPQALGHVGYLPDRAAYLARLRDNDMVLSTALHDFQGLAVMEAVACGCLPVVPDRLAYVERFPVACRYPVPAATDADGSARAEGEVLARQVMALASQAAWPLTATQDWFWPSQAPQWQGMLQALARPHGN